MDSINYLRTYKDIENNATSQAKFKVTCKCGTKTVMTDAERTICRNCGKWLYRDKQCEFKYMTLETINRSKLWNKTK